LALVVIVARRRRAADVEKESRIHKARLGVDLDPVKRLTENGVTSADGRARHVGWSSNTWRSLTAANSGIDGQRGTRRPPAS
jgi:hypothetical protein